MKETSIDKIIRKRDSISLPFNFFFKYSHETRTFSLNQLLHNGCYTQIILNSIEIINSSQISMPY